MADDYAYDVFISYSSADRPWAKKLSDDLKARNVRCWWDHEQLPKGELWEPALLAALKSSRHFALLWSNNAKDSDWVIEELSYIKQIIDPTPGKGPLTPGRRLFPIYLQGDNKTLNRIQVFTALRDNKAYEAGPDNFDENLTRIWQDIVREIDETVKEKDPSLLVPLGVLAMTTDIINGSGGTPIRVPLGVNHDMETFLANLEIPSLDKLKERYGPKPTDWKPFGSGDRIEEVLNRLLNDPTHGMNKILEQLKIVKLRWRPIDLVTIAFEKVEEEAARLKSGLALLVIDTLSLCNEEIKERYSQLDGCFKNNQAVVLLLPPFQSHAPSGYLRNWLRSRGAPLLSGYYNPLPPDPRYPNWIMNVADEAELTRYMKAALGHQPTLVSASAIGKDPAIIT